MKTIQACLWFDSQAEEAAKFYTSVFGRSKIEAVIPYGKSGAQASGRPEGTVMTVDFQLEGMSFLALNGGPIFQMNPTVSFFVGCESEEEMKHLWRELATTVRMDLQKYPFAEKYGWCQDRYGVNWQLMLGKREQKIMPALLFANTRYGKAEEAINFYVSQFPNAKIDSIARDEKTKAVLHAVFHAGGQQFVIMEGPLEPKFDFSPATSLVLHCETQEEIDAMWKKLSAVPEAENCGWLCDKYGLSWQIVAHDWTKWLKEASPEQRERLLSAVFKMKKPDLKKLREAMG